MKKKQHQPKALMAFFGNHRQNRPKSTAYHLKDDCQLVELTGGCIGEDTAAYSDRSQNPIVERLGLSLTKAQWLTSSLAAL